MKINELIQENKQIDEISLGKTIATKAARFAQGAGDVIGGTLGGIQGAWSRGKRAYQRGKEVVDPIANPPASSTNTTPSSTTNSPAPDVAAGAVGGIMQAIDKLDANSKKQLASELEQNIKATPAEPATAPTGGTNPAPVSKGPQGGDQPNKGFGFNPHTAQPFASAAERAAFDASPEAKMSTADWEASQSTGATPAAEPQGQSLDLDQLKKDREAKQAAGQAGQQQAQQQISATKQANAAQAQQDAAIKAAADAAKAKPPFQQTAADKLAIKAAADKGIREEDEEEVAEGFHSNFLGMMI
jgi:hypothetical protein